ncbi:hypothetical protein VTJ83DRAFT_5096 [Remersonia thermophila]|uniref:Uncharacterized protein n=1 Tax=Remersonia thermophila TaxID=72144 RepID=A0ABR4DBT4_9PEZI
MRDSTLFLLASAATLASAGRLECLYSRSAEFANTSPCGDVAALSYCLSHLDVFPTAVPSETERCFVWAGCTEAEAAAQAARVLGECDHPTNELKLIRRQFLAAEGDASSAGSSLPAAVKDTQLLVGRAAAAAAGAAAAPFPITGVPRQPRAETLPTGSPGQCFSQETTETTACPIITTGTESGRRGECVPTILVNEKCIEGLICAADARGNVNCMYKHSQLDLAGVILAIVFSTAIVVSIVAICFMCCRERSQHRKMERAAEAARIAKEAKAQATAAAKRPGAAVTQQPNVEGQPLMYQGGAGAPGGPPAPPTRPRAASTDSPGRAPMGGRTRLPKGRGDREREEVRRQGDRE